mmetsp:Transcript_19332/g.41619  ORF Transcript_19332/g.41619 Transcript_19332/m.41619 type:complete len:100 (-) Transcript_19332:192-491(-)
MKSAVFVLFFLAAFADAFVMTNKQKLAISSSRTPLEPMQGFFGDQERESLTRDNEPEEFFATNTDKMSDEEKIPIAIAGIVGITVPFIAGLIALYAAKY